MNYKVFMSFAFAALMLCSCKNSKPEAVRNVDTRSEVTDKEYLTGHFVSDYDGSQLTISAREDGRYNIVSALSALPILKMGRAVMPKAALTLLQPMPRENLLVDISVSMATQPY